MFYDVYIMGTSAAAKAYDHVHAQIIAGVIPAGEMLSEGAIADAVGCSRTPVREALQRLQAEGMVRIYPKKGALVVPVTAQDAEDVWQARALVEGWAAPIAFAVGAELRSELARVTDQMERAYDAGDVAAFTQSDRDFHEVIVASAGNAVLTRLYRSLRERQVRINALAMRVSGVRMQHAICDHRLMTDLICGEDEAAFVDLTLAHLDAARQNISHHGEGVR